MVVLPGEEKTQQLEDVVVYQLKFADWKTDLARPDDKQAKVHVRVIHGEPLNLRLLPGVPGSSQQEIRVTGGSRRGMYEIVRLVKSKPHDSSAAEEIRRQAFTLKVV